MSFTPVNADHAIEAVSFSLLLADPLDQAAVNSLRSNHKLWRSELPAVNTPQALQVQMDPSLPAPMTRAERGVEFSFLRPDGTPAWILRALAQEITVECSRYTRWGKIWGKASKFISDATRVITSSVPDQKIIGLILVVLDRFRADQESYDLKTLLAQNEYTAGKIFASGPTWHNYIGWFEDFNGVPLLHNLNVDAKREPYTGGDGNQEGAVFVAIHHMQQLRFPQPVRMSEFCSTEGAAPLSTAMEFMHSRNKGVVSQLLTPSMRERIGLEIAE